MNRPQFESDHSRVMIVPPATSSVIWLKYVPMAIKTALLTVFDAAMTRPSKSAPSHLASRLWVGATSLPTPLVAAGVRRARESRIVCDCSQTLVGSLVADASRRATRTPRIPWNGYCRARTDASLSNSPPARTNSTAGRVFPSVSENGNREVKRTMTRIRKGLREVTPHTSVRNRLGVTDCLLGSDAPSLVRTTKAVIKT
mmetsp:Transcript_40300/g.90471  ORF Transcript_40300/g.90471 Transcript_40300/m.90471 type:complete len:200 (-) Transcript_40300:520-1119(-)